MCVCVCVCVCVRTLRTNIDKAMIVHIFYNRISICTEYMDGGSLDHYGAIPEPILGKIAVGVSGHYYYFIIFVVYYIVDCKRFELSVEYENHAQR